MSATLAASNLTAEELAARVGAIPLYRIRLDPPPGNAVEDDVARLRREDGRLYELIDGVLVEKVSSELASFLGMELATRLGNFIAPARVGWIMGANGYVRLSGKNLRAADVSFVHRRQRPNGLLTEGYADVAPMLAAEVFSPGNSAGEMDRKRREFFAAGAKLFWIVYPEEQEIEVYTAPDSGHTLTRDDTLDGGTVLPGFTLRVSDLFAAADLGEPAE
jgi:Uma2 family endonuclease